MNLLVRLLQHYLHALTAIASCLVLSSCSTLFEDSRSKLIISVSDQKLLLTSDGVPIKAYKVSTSKFGLGSRLGSNRTPIGKMAVAKKIGGSAPKGMVFKSRRPTGEILRPNAPGRDPIVTRILWLRGKEKQNRNTFRRCIYIHGTPEEWRLGSPASYGCIRMASSDIVDLYKRIGVGAEVYVIRGPLTTTPEGQRYAGAKPSTMARRR